MSEEQLQNEAKIDKACKYTMFIVLTIISLLLSISSLTLSVLTAKGGINLGEKKNLSVSTSGDYEKFHLSLDGQKYCHIIDPETGYPPNTGIASVTLLGVDGALSDALTTALCLKNYTPNADNCTLTDFTKIILQEYPAAWIFIVYEKEGQKILLTNRSQNLEFTLNDNEYVIKNI